MPRSTAQQRNAHALTDKQARFVSEYVIDQNGRRAAEAAGYSVRTAGRIGSDLVATPHVRAAIDARLAKLARKLELTAEGVISDIVRVAKKAESAREFAAALKGYELLGKHLKLFTELHEHAGKDGAPLLPTIDLSKMTPDQLRALAAIPLADGTRRDPT